MDPRVDSIINQIGSLLGQQYLEMINRIENVAPQSDTAAAMAYTRRQSEDIVKAAATNLADPGLVGVPIIGEGMIMVSCWSARYEEIEEAFHARAGCSYDDFLRRILFEAQNNRCWFFVHFALTFDFSRWGRAMYYASFTDGTIVLPAEFGSRFELFSPSTVLSRSDISGVPRPDALPLRTFREHVKRVRFDESENEPSATRFLDFAFPNFRGSSRNEEERKRLFSKAFGDNSIEWFRKLNPQRRYSGGSDLPRRRYYTLCAPDSHTVDRAKHDRGVLRAELSAYSNMEVTGTGHGFRHAC
jgi:hypothetical protein